MIKNGLKVSRSSSENGRPEAEGRRSAIFKKYVQKNKVFSVIDQNDTRKVGKKQEKYWKNIFYSKLLEKIFSNSFL